MSWDDTDWNEAFTLHTQTPNLPWTPLRMQSPDILILQIEAHIYEAAHWLRHLIRQH